MQRMPYARIHVRRSDGDQFFKNPYTHKRARVPIHKRALDGWRGTGKGDVRGAGDWRAGERPLLLLQG